MHILYDLKLDLDAFLNEMERREPARGERRHSLSDPYGGVDDDEPTKH